MALAKRFFRIQYVSDLHLECYDKAVFPLLVKPAARYLALAGDIGHPGHPVFESFLRYASDNWDHVIYVPGTKEFSCGKPVHETHVNLIVSTERYPNIHYLHHYKPAFTTKENVVILGATLWPKNEHYPNIKVQRVESPSIPQGSARTLGPPITHEVNEESRAMLEAQIRFRHTQKQPICMLTHHMPSIQLLSSRFLTTPKNNRYVADCEDLMMPPVKAWIYGRTHNVSTGMLNGVFTAVNARGYPNETVPGFTPTAFLEFPVEQSDVEIDLELAKSAYETPI
jgi:hypothetical protein